MRLRRLLFLAILLLPLPVIAVGAGAVWIEVVHPVPDLIGLTRAEALDRMGPVNPMAILDPADPLALGWSASTGFAGPVTVRRFTWVTSDRARPDLIAAQYSGWLLPFGIHLDLPAQPGHSAGVYCYRRPPTCRIEP